MEKIYRLKPYDAVTNHHFIDKKRWDALADCKNLNVEFLEGFLLTSAVIHPEGVAPALGNVYIVSKDDLYEVKPECEPTPNVEKTTNVDSNATAEKTYTKKDIRKASARVMNTIDDEDEAVNTAIALARLICELK